jgi:ABC-type sugar transport system substrate-binding protein
MRSLLLATVGLLFLLLSFTGGCGKSSESSSPDTASTQSTTQHNQQHWRIGFAMTMDDPYWQNMVVGAKDEAQQLGVSVTFLNAQEDVQKQAQQINDLVAQGVDAVCLVPMKPDGLVNSVRALNEAKIPVIIVNREIGPGCDYVAFTGTDTYDGAVTSAKLLMQAIGGQGQIVEFQQVLGTGPQLLRSKALQDVLKDYPKVQLVAQVPHEGNDSKVVAAVGTLLGRYPELKGIYVHGDPQAIAAASACQSAGRNDIAVVGMGGSVQAIEAIKQGKLTGTSYQRPEEEGRSGVRLAVRCLRGEKLEKRYPIPCPPITKANAAEFHGQF